MDVYSFILANREVFKLIYAIAILLICIIIVYKTNRLFHLSSHPGIRYFRNAFFFYGMAFFSRYILNYLIGSFASIVFFEFFLIIAGFFLLYSLIWRHLEKEKWSASSLFNSKISLFYAMALALVLIDFLWGTIFVMLASQVIVFVIASILSFKNYKKRQKSRFPGFYFLAMLLMLSAWILNSLAAFFFNWNLVALINVYIFNVLFFLVFLFGVVKFTNH